MKRLDPPDGVRRALWAALLAGSLLSLFVTYLVSDRTLVLGSRSGGWVYEYLYGFQPHTLVVWAMVWGCCAVVALVPLAEVRRHQWRIVGMWLLVGLLVQGVLRSLTPYSLEQMFVSDGSNGFYSAAQQYRPSELLGDFDRVRPTFASVHARSNMPGKVLFTYGLEMISSRPAVLPWLVIVLSDLGGLLLYLFVRDFLENREAALLSLVFYLIVPGKLVFLPVLNTVTPLLVFGCAWLWLRLLQSREVKFAVALGIAAYVVVLFEPTPAVLTLLFAILTAHALWRRDVEWPTALRLTGIAIAASLAAYVLLLAWFGFDLVASVRAIARDAIDFNAGAKRPYGTWVAANLRDLFFGAGLCQSVLFVCAVGLAFLPSSWRDGPGRGRLAALSLGSAAAILAADLAGINRGEVVRLWIFLACVVQIPAACFCATLNSRLAIALVLGTTLLQTAVSTSMFAFGQP